MRLGEAPTDRIRAVLSREVPHASLRRRVFMRSALAVSMVVRHLAVNVGNGVPCDRHRQLSDRAWSDG